MTILETPKSANPGTPGVASTSAETFSDFRLRPGNQLTPRQNPNHLEKMKKRENRYGDLLENILKKDRSGDLPKKGPKTPKIGLGATIISTPNIAF